MQVYLCGHSSYSMKVEYMLFMYQLYCNMQIRISRHEDFISSGIYAIYRIHGARIHGKSLEPQVYLLNLESRDYF